jgi:hypothetical protein
VISERGDGGAMHAAAGRTLCDHTRPYHDYVAAVTRAVGLRASKRK